MGKTLQLLEILFILFTFHFVTERHVPLKPLNVARCARFGGITRRKHCSDLARASHTASIPQSFTG